MLRFQRFYVLLLVVSLAAAASVCPPRLGATTLARMSLSQMARAAALVVRGRFVSSASRWEGGAIWTVSDLQVLEVFKGAPPAQIQVRLPGGRVGHIAMNVEAAPRFAAGEEGILFLEKNAAGDYSVTAWAEGTFRISGSASSSESVVTQDSSALPIFDPATRQFRSEGVRNLPLSQFRARLAAALGSSYPGNPSGNPSENVGGAR